MTLHPTHAPAPAAHALHRAAGGGGELLLQLALARSARAVHAPARVQKPCKAMLKCDITLLPPLAFAVPVTATARCRCTHAAPPTPSSLLHVPARASAQLQARQPPAPALPPPPPPLRRFRSCGSFRTRPGGGGGCVCRERQLRRLRPRDVLPHGQMHCNTRHVGQYTRQPTPASPAFTHAVSGVCCSSAACGARAPFGVTLETRRLMAQLLTRTLKTLARMCVALRPAPAPCPPPHLRQHSRIHMRLCCSST